MTSVCFYRCNTLNWNHTAALAPLERNGALYRLLSLECGIASPKHQGAQGLPAPFQWDPCCGHCLTSLLLHLEDIHWFFFNYPTWNLCISLDLFDLALYVWKETFVTFQPGFLKMNHMRNEQLKVYVGFFLLFFCFFYFLHLFHTTDQQGWCKMFWTIFPLHIQQICIKRGPLAKLLSIDIFMLWNMLFYIQLLL